jgi:hypothetical protein
MTNKIRKPRENFTPDQRLAEAHMDITLLKKATAFFIRDNPALK